MAANAVRARGTRQSRFVPSVCRLGSLTVLLSPLLLAGTSAFLPGAAAGGAETASSVVELRYFAFQPNHTTVQVGTEIVFLNRQDETHQFVWREQPIPGVTLLPGDSWRWKFSDPGVYEFRCLYDSTDFDRGMRGRVVVIAEQAAPGPPVVPEASGPGPDPTRLLGLSVLYGPPLLALSWLWWQGRTENPTDDKPAWAGVAPTPGRGPERTPFAARLRTRPPENPVPRSAPMPLPASATADLPSGTPINLSAPSGSASSKADTTPTEESPPISPNPPDATGASESPSPPGLW